VLEYFGEKSRRNGIGEVGFEIKKNIGFINI
jgi:hypothetical protein